MLAKGPSSALTATILSASSTPIPRTPESPRRTAGPAAGGDCPAAGGGDSSVASAPLAFTSGPITVTPWRRASATRVCGDQNPIGWELSSEARKAAG
jgi:hypothetical protein